MIVNTIKKAPRKAIFYLIFAVCVYLRFFKLGEIPLGLNQDEAFSAYEALNLLKNKTDSWGYRFPMYFIAWGSGMNVLYSYILAAFFSLLGTSDLIVRLPQALLSVLSCYIFYRLMRFLYGKKTGLWRFFIISVTPWHIMLSRWGLESNTAPTFLLAGFYFFCLGTKKGKYLILSALCYGAALYTYAATWLFIAITLPLSNICLIWQKAKYRLPELKYIFAELFIFGLCAIPVFLFLLVNFEIMEEIKTTYLSIPKMIYWRSGEVGVDNMALKLKTLWRILIKGNDFLKTNAIEPFGIFYKISPVFIAIGLFLLTNGAKKDRRENRFSYNLLILLHIIIGLFYATMLYPCINRLNFLWFYLLIAQVLALSALPYKTLTAAAVAGYILFFGCFSCTYFKDYNKLATEWFSPNFKEALDYAEQKHLKTRQNIYILAMPAVYPKILFYNNINASDFQNTVVWKNFPSAYLEPLSFLHYRFDEEPNYQEIPAQNIYIVPAKKAYYFYNFEIARFKTFAVATPKTDK